jgi:flavin-dependent dehydrogenase
MMIKNSEYNFDVLVVGGGPAGSTAATVLSQYGRKVALLEKDDFPRYHVGESMIPYTYFPLKRIGMISKLKKYPFVKKNSVQFASINGRDSQPFYFAEHMNHPAAQTWQAERSQFDKMLLENAKENGVKVIQGVKADKIFYDQDKVSGILTKSNDGQTTEYNASVIIDATGRNGLATKRFGWSIPDPALQKVAIWNYFKGAKRDSGIDEGATTIAYLPEKGWFWYIPLQDDIVSVGVVADKNYLYDTTRDPEHIFQREIKNNKWIEDHLSGSQVSDKYRVTGDYSYRAKHSAADGIVLTGDAFAFLDPVFSSGLYFALKGGEMAADHVECALRDGDVSAKQFTKYSEIFCKYIESMRRLVYVFYDKDFSFRPLFEKHPHLSVDVTDLLIGNLDKDFTELFQAMEEFVVLPEPLKHGRPMVGKTVN